MNHIQTDRSEEALVAAIRLNLCDFYHHMSRSLPDGHFEDEKFTRWCSSLGYPWFNGMLSSQPPDENDENFIQETMQYFRSQGVSAFTWWMEPHIRPSDWNSLLSKHGFRFSDDTPGMAADLEALNESIETPDGFKVCAVTDEESLRKWSQVFTLGYSLPPDWDKSIYDVWLKLGLGFPMGNYLGLLNGTLVATSSIYFGGGVAGIYSVSTLPQARGKGIGAAMTLKPLQDAREMGYRIGVLQSSEMGYGVYKKLGFRHLCQVEYFYHSLP